MTLRLTIFDAGGHFGRHLSVVRGTVQQAIDHTLKVSGLSNVDIALHPTDYGKDQFAVGAFTMGPHNIHIGVERSQLSSEELEDDLFRVTVHELHHALRWRHAPPDRTVADAVAMEGLAMLADHAAVGPQDEVDRPLSDPKAAIADLVGIRDDPLLRHRNWLYTSEASQPGGVSRVYTMGWLLMQPALELLGMDAWQAATLSSQRLLDAGLEKLAFDEGAAQRTA